MTPAPPTLADISAAARRIHSYVARTPFVRSAWLSQLTSASIWLKLEIDQPTGSFKIRGATNAIARLRETQPDARSVTTASAGNHGSALAWAGRQFGVAVRVHLPETAPASKKSALRDHGATVLEAPTYDEAERRAHAEADESFISAYSHSDVIAGAGTAAIEMFEDEPGLDTLIVPLGGGGLLSGTAIVARAAAPGALIIGAEAAASPVFTAGLAAGRPVTVDVRPTLADGLAGNMEPDSQTFGIIRDLVDRVVTVEEPAIERAMQGLQTCEGCIVEGAGAAAVAALLESGLHLRGRRVGVLVTGKNR